jgi:hypothetical protein
LPFEEYPVSSRGALAGVHKPLVREAVIRPPTIPGHVATALMGRNTGKSAVWFHRNLKANYRHFFAKSIVGINR